VQIALQELVALFDKVRALPEPRRQAALEALMDLTAEPYVLSRAELAVLEPALERARLGKFAEPGAMADLLDTPWS